MKIGRSSIKIIKHMDKLKTLYCYFLFIMSPFFYMIYTRALILLWTHVNGHIIFKGIKVLSFLKCILCVGAFCLHVCRYTTCKQCPQRPEESIGCPTTGVIEGCEQPCACWELNTGPRQGQPVVLLTAKPSLPSALQAG